MTERYHDVQVRITVLAEDADDATQAVENAVFKMDAYTPAMGSYEIGTATLTQFDDVCRGCAGTCP
jgi:hypothetical protein